MARLKRRLSEKEEFEIMKLVLDKFLWIGAAIMGWGLYKSLVGTFADGIWFMLGGAIMFILFAWFVIKEFEFIR